MMNRVALLILTALVSPVLAPHASLAQAPPPHPSMPWSPLRRDQQQVLRYIRVPAQRVVIDVPVPPPPAPPAGDTEAREPRDTNDAKEATNPKDAKDAKAPKDAKDGEDLKDARDAKDKDDDRPAAPPDTPTPSDTRQVLEVPGPVIAETTTGYQIPARWTLERAGAGYRWRRLPAEFRPK